MEMDEKIQYAIEHTEVVQAPRQSLATFGTTNIYYYLVCELMETVNVVREGRVIASRPRIVTPSYLINLEGFSGQAKRFFEMLAECHPQEAGIYYSYKNEPLEMNVASAAADEVIEKISRRIEERGDRLSAIIKGVEELWDVSLLKFTFELTRSSVNSNLAEFSNRGLLGMDEEGVPGDARMHIEEMFRRTERDHSYAPHLVSELKRWGLLEEYQDRFLRIFHT